MNKSILFSLGLLGLTCSHSLLADDIDTFIQASQDVISSPFSCPILYKQALALQQKAACSTIKTNDNNNDNAIDKAADCQASISLVLGACSAEVAPPKLHNFTPVQEPASTSTTSTNTNTNNDAATTNDAQPDLNNQDNTMVAPQTSSGNIKPFSFGNSANTAQERQ